MGKIVGRKAPLTVKSKIFLKPEFGIFQLQAPGNPAGEEEWE